MRAATTRSRRPLPQITRRANRFLMDNQRVFIWAALALVLYLNFMAWQGDYAPKPPPPVAAKTTSTEGATGSAASSSDALPELPSTSSAPAAETGTAAPAIGGE